MRPHTSQTQAFDAAFQAATAAHQAGRFAEAVAQYEALLPAANDDPQLLYLLGAAYAEVNRFDDSARALQRSLSARPDHLPTVEMLGSVWARSGDPGKSVAYFQLADRLAGGTAETIARLANAQRLAGKHAEARDSYRRLLAREPGHRQGLVGLAMSLAGLGDLAAAEQCLRESLQQHPDYAAAHVTLGSVLGQSERFAEAERVLRDFLAKNPSHLDARRTLGTSVHKQGRLAEAEAIYREILGEKMDAQAALQLAEALIDLSRLDESETILNEIKDSSPSRAAVLTGLGRIQELRGNLEAAIALHTEAIDHDPSYENAYVNRGSAKRFSGAFEAALSDYDTALTIRPNFPPAVANRGLTLLILGRIGEAWPHYRSRIKARPGALDLSGDKPWDGSPLRGKRVLVWLEYGLGDEILFANLLPELIDTAAHCTIACAPRLHTLFTRSFPRARIVAPGDPLGDAFDVRLPLTDAAQLLRPTLSSFPKHTGYLAADAGLTASLRRRYLNGREGRLIGLSWRSASGPAGRFKSVELAEWAEILRQPGATFVSLQYGECADEIARASKLTGSDIIHDRDIDTAGDLDPFAAQVAAMDLVVSVSNTTVHVAGALGRPVWVLVPSGPGAHWYWFLDRRDNPWYPSARLFRQERRGEWKKPLGDVSAELGKWLQP